VQKSTGPEKYWNKPSLLGNDITIGIDSGIGPLQVQLFIPSRSHGNVVPWGTSSVVPETIYIIGVGQFTFFRQDFYKTNYIYGFGTTEDVPQGYNVAVTFGMV